MAPKRKSENNDSKPPKKGKNEEISTDNFSSDAKTKGGKLWNFKIVSWNVAGVRAWIKKDGMSIFDKEDPDIICLQEIKSNESTFPKELKSLKNYEYHTFSAKKEGYSGVAFLSKVKPISVTRGFEDPEHDSEGRLITAEFQDFFLVSAYVPNAGKKLVTLDKRMDWDPKLLKHLKELDSKKPVIYCGDFNVAHKEIDLANPKSNKRNAGFTQEERDGFSHLLSEGSFVDSFRSFYPDLPHQYSFWTYMMNARAKNVGWRLDYFVVSERFMPSVCDSVIRSSVMGSDHCPITLLIHLESK
ncbi:UNVERIFIED_CONTAM: hypothetical protein GTU68_004956 [Idotea baltica]|nr:hypothetical protein [Idotea baltica]